MTLKTPPLSSSPLWPARRRRSERGERRRRPWRLDDATPSTQEAPGPPGGGVKDPAWVPTISVKRVAKRKQRRGRKLGAHRHPGLATPSGSSPPPPPPPTTRIQTPTRRPSPTPAAAGRTTILSWNFASVPAKPKREVPTNVVFKCGMLTLAWFGLSTALAVSFGVICRLQQGGVRPPPRRLPRAAAVHLRAVPRWCCGSGVRARSSGGPSRGGFTSRRWHPWVLPWDWTMG
mmetsp:Transcript_32771/g.80719  ORF Transcript_32771/g.80719 Transcript_32771/m.80719 type:complete len:232 (+) Transcript_32771:98-793(+)